jgi:hypothetical protein
MTPRARGSTPGGRPGQFLAAGEWVLLGVLLVFFLIRGLVPGWRVLNTDFPNYYLTAALRVQGAPTERAYEWIWFQRHKDHREISQPLVGYVPNPPLCAAPLLPLASLPALSAKRVWILLNLVFLAVALWIMHRVTELPCRSMRIASANQLYLWPVLRCDPPSNLPCLRCGGARPSLYSRDSAGGSGVVQVVSRGFSPAFLA